MTESEAYRLLPPAAEFSSSFGNPGEGGYVEWFRTPEGERWSISNGHYALQPADFDWQAHKWEG